MKKILNLIIFFIIIISGQSSYSKPIPPGSGAGDVPANILILLDSSNSMKKSISGVNDAITEPRDVVELSDGNIILAQGRGGLVKILTSTGEKDDTFAEGNVEFTGNDSDANCELQNSSINGDSQTISLDVSSNVDGIDGEVVFVAHSVSSDTDTEGKVVVMDPSGKCIDVIDHNELGADSGVGFNPYALTIKTIGGKDHLFVSGKRTSDNKKSHFYSKNLTTGDFTSCDIEWDSGQVFKKTPSITVDNGNFLYAQYSGHVFKFKLKSIGANNLCPITNKAENLAAGGLNNAYYKKINYQNTSCEASVFQYSYQFLCY